jgi:hypothetical protein
MKYNIELLKADILDELAKIEKLRQDFLAIMEKILLPEKEIPHYDRAAIGYYLHGFYNGCENMASFICRFTLSSFRAGLPAFWAAMPRKLLAARLNPASRGKDINRTTQVLSWGKV